MPNLYLSEEEPEDQEIKTPVPKPAKLLYENQLIGIFLYGLGIAVGRRSDADLPVVDALSLLQQTPGDPLMGDLLLQKAQRAYLIEFKRTFKEVKTENEKIVSIREVVDDELLDQVWFGHLLAYGSQGQAPQVGLNIEPYFAEHPCAEAWTFDSFADQFLSGEGGADPGHFQKYLELLLSSKESSGGSGVFVVQTTDGQICFHTVSSVADLSLRASELLGPRQPPPTQSIRPGGRSR